MADYLTGVVRRDGTQVPIGDVTGVTSLTATAPIAVDTSAGDVTVSFSGAVAATNGGTGQTTITQGDLLYGSAADTIAKLAKNTTATRSLTNTGTNNAPAWAQVALATGVSGTLPVTNGGTGLATFAAGDIPYASASNTIAALSKGTASQTLKMNAGATAPEWVTVSGGDTVNVETLSGNKTLVAGTDATFQVLTNGASVRTITLQTTGSPTAGSKFTIVNASENEDDVELRINSGATALDYISRGSQKSFQFDGTIWRGITAGSANGIAGTGGYPGMAVGYQTQNWKNLAMVVGMGSSNRNTKGINIGIANTLYADNGVVIGYGCGVSGANSLAAGYTLTADAANVIVLGDNGSSNGKASSKVFGPRAIAQRYGERVYTTTAGNVASVQNYSNSVLTFIKETTDATPVEAFLDNSALRATILANSAVSFRANVIAYCNGATKAKSWRVEGSIRRDGANNTTLVPGTVKAVTSDESTPTAYDVNFTADDTNEALKVTVTGAAAETVRWFVTCEFSEVRF